jgi:hypothetical protein
MDFVQTIDLTTTKYDELRAVGDELIGLRLANPARSAAQCRRSALARPLREASLCSW